MKQAQALNGNRSICPPPPPNKHTHTRLSAHNMLDRKTPSPCCVHINSYRNTIIIVFLFLCCSQSRSVQDSCELFTKVTCLRVCFPSIPFPTWSCMPLSTLQCLIISKTCKCIHIHGGTDAKLTVAGTHLTVPASQSASSRYRGRDVEGRRKTGESENKEARGRRAGKGGREK